MRCPAVALVCLAVLCGAPPTRHRLELADCDDVAFGPDGDLYLACHSPEDRLQIAVRGAKTAVDEMDAYVLRLNPRTGKLVFATRFAGNSYDAALRIKVDDQGFAYTTGVTKSSDFPGTVDALQRKVGGGRDAFVAKISPSGEIVYSTPIGGSGVDVGSALDIDSRGNVYVGGWTSSNDFPVQVTRKATTENNAFVCRLRTDRHGMSCRVFGGGKDEMLTGIALDRQGGIYAAGSTSSADFPVLQPTQKMLGGRTDVFLTRLDVSSLEITFSTFIGGSGDDTGWGVVVDKRGDPTVAGTTDSTDLPGTTGSYQPSNRGKKDAFLASIRMRHRRQVRATYFGGANNDESGYDGGDIKVDRRGNLWVTGTTYSDDLPTRKATQARFGGGDGDGFVAAFSPDLSKLCVASYHGDENRNLLEGIAISPSGLVAVAGVSFAPAPSALHIQIGRANIFAGANVLVLRAQEVCAQ
ncbi:MAG: SBBP repeat-containing protein [Bryobacteraceae bacterium]